jgi:hypothetical protein
MELLPIYITADTIERLQVPLKIGDFQSMENARDVFEMIEFLKHGSYIHLDKHNQDLNLGDLFETNPLLAHLISGGNGRRRIEFRPEEHQSIVLKGLSAVKTHQSAQYFTMDLKEEDSKSMEGSTGMLHHTLKSSHRTLGRIFRTHVEFFRKDRMASMDIIFEKLLPHHSIVIIDPYLLRWDNSHLVRFLTRAKPGGIGTYHVTLVFSTKTSMDNDKNPSRWITRRLQLLKNDLRTKIGNSKIELEFLVVKNDEFHDRMILTNNQVVFQGYGMETMNRDGKGRKLTTWIFISHTKMDTRLNGEISCHFKNISDITDAIHEWKMTAEPYSSPQLRNPILKRGQEELRTTGLQARGTSLDELYKKINKK